MQYCNVYFGMANIMLMSSPSQTPDRYRCLGRPGLNGCVDGIY
jgi:hypothetical protein